MKGDPVEMAMLYDFYGDILTHKQKEYYEMYYEGDYSLSEISENEGITRQGVRDVISRAEKILRDMEEKLGLVARYGNINAAIIEIQRCAAEILSVNDSRYLSEEIRHNSARIIELSAAIR